MNLINHFIFNFHYIHFYTTLHTLINLIKSHHYHFIILEEQLAIKNYDYFFSLFIFLISCLTFPKKFYPSSISKSHFMIIMFLEYQFNLLRHLISYIILLFSQHLKYFISIYLNHLLKILGIYLIL
jgi:hypothetical protein